jgi:hypothetical protein
VTALKPYHTGLFKTETRFYLFPKKIKGKRVWGRTTVKLEYMIYYHSRGLNNFGEIGPSHYSKWVIISVV